MFYLTESKIKCKLKLFEQLIWKMESTVFNKSALREGKILIPCLKNSEFPASKN